MTSTWEKGLRSFIPACQQVVPVIDSVPLVDAKVNVDYTYDVQTTGYTYPTYSLVSAPAGMAINPDTGHITWLPTATGTYNVIVHASNSIGSHTQSFTVTVRLPGYANIASQAVVTASRDRKSVV